MQRKYAFLIAGFFTALATTAAIAASGLAGANAAPPAVVSVPEPAAVQVASVQSTFAVREQMLQAQLTQATKAVEKLDTDAQAAVAGAQSQLTALAAEAATHTENVALLQAQLASLQTAISQDAQLYQQELAALQGNEVQVRQQLQDTLGQLQLVYDALAQRQADQVALGNGGSNGNEGGRTEHEEHDGDDDHGEQGEHEEGGDD